LNKMAQGRAKGQVSSGDGTCTPQCPFLASDSGPAQIPFNGSWQSRWQSSSEFNGPAGHAFLLSSAAGRAAELLSECLLAFFSSSAACLGLTIDEAEKHGGIYHLNATRQ
jgi:hypothetical protein